jgi:hypothetical protein
LGCDGDLLNEYGHCPATAFIVSFLLGEELVEIRNKTEFLKL